MSLNPISAMAGKERSGRSPEHEIHHTQRLEVRPRKDKGGVDVISSVRLCTSLLLEFNIQFVAVSVTGDFHRVRLGIAPDHLTRFRCNRLRFSIRRCELERATCQPINRMVRM